MSDPLARTRQAGATCGHVLWASRRVRVGGAERREAPYSAVTASVYGCMARTLQWSTAERKLSSLRHVDGLCVSSVE